MSSIHYMSPNGFQPDGAMKQSIEALKDGALALLRAAELIETSVSRDTGARINFYDEVRRFEIDLLLFALKQMDGNQAKAARFLSLKKTTLNHKVKQYKIDSASQSFDNATGENVQEFSRRKTS
jgi:transcriptional regulator with GAF, ATPase, and Fis domain